MTSIRQLAPVPPGSWAVGVSGGADSVALLLLLVQSCPHSTFHIAHLDHETRGEHSTLDAQFVRELSARLNVPCTVAPRSEIESTVARIDPNPSARFRIARLRLFERVAREHGLAGVLLAHHADDQAETVLHRLLRGGSSVNGLAGMSPDSRVGGLRILRPLLGVRREALRDFLRSSDQSWREDASNASDRYLRNRLRRLLSPNPRLTELLLDLSQSCRTAREWVVQQTPSAPASLKSADLLTLPVPLQRELARRWLIRAGVPNDRTDPDVVQQLLHMARDAATPSRLHFPGKVLVRRTRGTFTAEQAPSDDTRIDSPTRRGRAYSRRPGSR